MIEIYFKTVRDTEFKKIEDFMNNINATGPRFQSVYDKTNDIRGSLGCVVMTGIAIAAIYFYADIYNMFFKPQYS
jgi:hypothetical protein